MGKKTYSCNVSRGVNPHLVSHSTYLISLAETMEVAYPSGIKFCKTALGYHVKKCIHYYPTGHAILQHLYYHLMSCFASAMTCLLAHMLKVNTHS